MMSMSFYSYINSVSSSCEFKSRVQELTIVEEPEVGFARLV